VERTGRHVAAAGDFGVDLLVEASSFLPAIAVLPWARSLESDFRLKVLEGNALLQQGDPEAASEAWISAADQAGAMDEPIYGMELLRAAFAALEGGSRERERVIQRAYPILSSLMKRLPDERSLAELVMSLGRSAPFELRYRSLGAVLFAPKVQAADMERARQLLEEAVRLGHSNEGVEIATLLEARKGVDPDLLFLCARAHDAGGNHRKAQEIWGRLREAARARGREDLHTACLVHMEANTSDEEARVRLAGLERKLENQPFAMAAWLDRASRYEGFVEEAHVDRALELLERMPEVELADVLRKVSSSLSLPEGYRCKLAANLLTHGLAQPVDLDGIDPELPDENMMRRLFRALRLSLKKTIHEGLRVSAEALMGRILFHRYDRPDDARAHLQTAWDGGLRGRHLADDLARVFIDSGYPQAAQRILLTHLLSEQDPEERVELGVHLLELLPVGTPLLSELRTLLVESSRMVPWDERLRYLLEIRRGVADAEEWTHLEAPSEGASAEVGLDSDVQAGPASVLDTPLASEPSIPPQREDVLETDEVLPEDDELLPEDDEVAPAQLPPSPPLAPVPDSEDLEAEFETRAGSVEVALEPDVAGDFVVPEDLVEEVVEEVPEDSDERGEAIVYDLAPVENDSGGEEHRASGFLDAANTDTHISDVEITEVAISSREFEPVSSGSDVEEEAEVLELASEADTVSLEYADTAEMNEPDAEAHAFRLGTAKTQAMSPDPPDSADGSGKRARELHEEELGQIRKLTGVGAFDDARRRVRALLKEAPDLSEAHVLLVVVAEAQGRLSEAVDHLLSRIDTGLNSEESRPLMLHALDLLVAAHRNEEARVHLSAWLARDPELEEALTPPLKELLATISS